MGFYIFNKFISYYGLCISIGIVFGSIVSYCLCKKEKYNYNDFIIISGVLSLFSILGAKLLYLIISYKSIDFSLIKNLRYVSYLMNSGFVFYGGLIGCILGFLFLQYFFSIESKKYISIIVTIIPLLHGFGRIGCYLVGCCYGIQYNSRIFSKIYRNSIIAPNNISLFPVQIIESFFNFIIFIILYYMYTYEKKSLKDKIIYVYLYLYSILRFILEFYRGDILRGKILLSTSQWISILIIMFLTVKCVYERSQLCMKKKKKF